MSEAICKGCGKPIVWGETPDGKKVPLDPKPLVYMLLAGRAFGTNLQRIERLQQDEAMVSHFATCPNANDYSTSKRQPATA